MSSYQANDPNVLRVQLANQQLRIPFTVTGGNGTPGNVVFTTPYGAIAGFQSASVDGTTPMLASGETAPTYTTTDSTGIFGALVAINEPVALVTDAEIVSQTTNGVCYANLTATPAGGITAGDGGGQKIALQCTIPTDLTSSAEFFGCLVVNYQTKNFP